MPVGGGDPGTDFREHSSSQRGLRLGEAATSGHEAKAEDSTSGKGVDTPSNEG